MRRLSEENAGEILELSLVGKIGCDAQWAKILIFGQTKTQPRPTGKLGFFHVFMSKNNFKHSHLSLSVPLIKNFFRFSRNPVFYLIKKNFHDPISTRWLKGFQKYFAYILPMLQACTQKILDSI